MKENALRRVYAYIDGWNFYLAINEPGRLRLGWCNFVRLFDALAYEYFKVEKAIRIKYINTPVRGRGDEIHDGEAKRAEMWFSALRIVTGLEPLTGRLVKDNRSDTRRREKEADVLLAVEMLSDAPDYDAAFLLSADTDFRPLVRKLTKELRKDVVVCYLEKGHHSPATDPAIPNWQNKAIPDSLLEACRLPDEIRDPVTGKIISWHHYLAFKGGEYPPVRH